MKRTALIQAIILFCLLIGSWVLLILRFTGEADAPTPPPPTPTAQSPSADTPARESIPQPPEAEPDSSPNPSVPEDWVEWIDAFRSLDSPAAMRDALAELREQLLSLPPEEAVSMILTFLESGIDVRTGLAFQVGPDGRLLGADSLRAMLLDWLFEIDPPAAAALAREALAVDGTALAPDEYTIHLRNYGLGSEDPPAEVRQFLENRLADLIAHEPWMENPTRAVAAAFEVAVHTRATRFVPDFSRLMARDRPQILRSAAAVSIEHLIDAAPLDSLRELLDEADEPDPLFRARAGYFARLDPSLDGAGQILDDYLSSPGVGPEEIRFFLESFPNLNRTFSYRLFGSQNPDTFSDDHIGRFGSALRQVREWQADPSMSAFSETLEDLEARLAGHLRHIPGT